MGSIAIADAAPDDQELDGMGAALRYIVAGEWEPAKTPIAQFFTASRFFTE